MTLVIAGERSGVGKTTITLAMLAYLSQKGYRLGSFKIGPDYIDPMFHTAVTSRPCYNLDPILTNDSYVVSCLQRYSQDTDLVIIEGVMGLFDGVQLTDCLDYGSTAYVARLLNLPVVLVIDCGKISTSVAAIAQGYRSFDPSVKIVGVILNRVKSDRHQELLETALESISLPILGVLRPSHNIHIPQRHLGLIPTQELENLNPMLAQLAHLAEANFDWKKLLPLLQVDKHFSTEPIKEKQAPIVSLAIAQDKAFSFYYPDQLDLLEELGAELLPWSPLEDTTLPKGTNGLIFGGGFPEVFAEQLSANLAAKTHILKAIKEGMPTYAECGGLMYLSNQITEQTGRTWSMVGAISTQTNMTSRLTLGYRQATALSDTITLKKGQTVVGHEFHYSQSEEKKSSPLFAMTRYGGKQNIPFLEGWSLPNLHASYLHIHFAQNIDLAKTFLNNCLDFRTKASYINKSKLI